MKKVLFAAAGLVALSIAPALAADLPARTYTKAPAMVAPIYNWGGFYVGVNGGGGSSHKCWDLNAVGGIGPIPAVAKVATMRPAASSVARSATAGRCRHFVFGLEAQGDWADLKGSNASSPAAFAPIVNQTKIDAIGLFTGQVGYAWNNVLGLCEGRRGRHQRQVQRPARRRHASTPPAKPAGAAWSVSASKSASRRIGRSRSNTTICSWADRNVTLQRLVGIFDRQRQYPSGRRHGHRPRQLPLRRPGGCEVLISRRFCSNERPALRRPFCLCD